MELSETADTSKPGMRFTVLDEPLTGAGTLNDPERVAWHDLGVAQRSYHGVVALTLALQHTGEVCAHAAERVQSGGGPPVLVATAGTVTDPDSANLAGGQLTVSIPDGGFFDRLAA